jgi:hypothetical protein
MKINLNQETECKLPGEVFIRCSVTNVVFDDSQCTMCHKIHRKYLIDALSRRVLLSLGCGLSSVMEQNSRKPRHSHRVQTTSFSSLG